MEDCSPDVLAARRDVSCCAGSNGHRNGTNKHCLILAQQIPLLTDPRQAIPQMTDEFNSAGDIGWYGSSYLVTCCAFQLLFGKVYTCFDIKSVFLANMLLFEVASAVCGAAPSSTVFIVGRALAGVGAAGIFAGTVSHPRL